MRKVEYIGLGFIFSLLFIALTGCSILFPKTYYKVCYFVDGVKENEFVTEKGKDFPKRSEPDIEGLIFRGWDIDGDGEVDELPAIVDKDYQIEAVFKKKGDLQIDFLDDEGNLIVSLFFDKDEDIIYDGPTPTKAPTERNEYVFNGWDKELGKATEATSFKATFKEQARLYTINVYDSTGRLKDTYKQEYHTLFPLLPNQTKESDETYSYRFTGYSLDGDDGTVDSTPMFVTDNYNCYPVFGKNYINYTVYFYDETTQLLKQTAHYGDRLRFPELNYKYKNNKYYGFVGYKKNDETGITTDTLVSGNDTYYAMYQDKNLTVIYINGDVFVECHEYNEKIDFNNYEAPSGYKYSFYYDSGLTNKCEGYTTNNDVVELYVKAEPLYELYTKVLDFNPDSKISSKEELTALFDYLLLTNTTTFDATLDYTPTDINEDIKYVTEHSTIKESYSIGTSYTPILKNLKFVITYTEKNTTESTPVNVQLPTLSSSTYPNKRSAMFDGFKINGVTKTFKCKNSEELFYTLEHGYRPIITNDKLNTLYEKMKDVLRTIIDDEMNDYEKVNAIYEWIINEVSYDSNVYDLVTTSEESTSKYHCFYLEGVFDYKLAVCDGISKAMACLCNMEGITCVKISGVSKTSGVRHAWNKVLIDNDWYIVDATSGGTIVNGTNEILTHKFLLIDENTYAPYYVEEVDELKNFKALGKYNFYEHKEVGEGHLSLLVNNEDDLKKVIEYLIDNGTTNTTLDCYLNFDYGTGISDEVQRALNKIKSSKSVSYFDDRNVLILILQ